MLKLVETRLSEPELDEYRRIQCCTILGTITSARAQGLAEDVLAKAGKDALLAFASEDAVLRSTIETQFGQPAWSRYQGRHSAAPKMTLREFQTALDELALPRAADRARAENKLGGMIDGDVRVLLALARSPWPERAAFALKQLEDLQSQELQLATQSVMLDLDNYGITLEEIGTTEARVREVAELVAADAGDQFAGHVADGCGHVGDQTVEGDDILTGDVGEFAREVHVLERRSAAGHVAGLAGRHTGP